MKFWQKRGVEILDYDLKRYVGVLGRQARAFPAAEAAA